MHEEKISSSTPNRSMFATIPYLLLSFLHIGKTMNCTKLQFSEKSFDVVFCKALIDTLLCGLNGFDIVTSMLSEAHRVLKPGGLVSPTFMHITYSFLFYRVFAIISAGDPDSRMLHFANRNFDVTYVTIPRTPDGQDPKREGRPRVISPDDPPVYMYILRKHL